MLALIRILRGGSMTRGDEREPLTAGEQPDLFGAPPAQSYLPDPDKVRARLHLILNEAKAAERLPWRPAQVSLYRTIFPQ